MSKLFTPKQQIFYKILCEEFIREFYFLKGVIDGRNEIRGDFIDKALSLIGTGARFVPMAVESIELIGELSSQTLEVLGAIESASGHATTLNGYRKERKIEVIGKLANKVDQNRLQLLIEEVGREAVRRYAYLIEKYTADSVIRLAKVGAFRILKYLGDKDCELTVENMLVGLMKGKTGKFIEKWRNNRLKIQGCECYLIFDISRDELAEHKKCKDILIQGKDNKYEIHYVSKRSSEYEVVGIDSNRENKKLKSALDKIYQLGHSFNQPCQNKEVIKYVNEIVKTREGYTSEDEEMTATAEGSYARFACATQTGEFYTHKKTKKKKEGGLSLSRTDDIKYLIHLPDDFIHAHPEYKPCEPSEHDKQSWNDQTWRSYIISAEEIHQYRREMEAVPKDQRISLNSYQAKKLGVKTCWVVFRGELSDIDLGECDISDCDFSGSKLKSCKLGLCKGTYFSGAEWVNVEANEADFSGAYLDTLIAKDCDFRNATCQQMSMRYARLTDCYFDELKKPYGLKLDETLFANQKTGEVRKAQFLEEKLPDAATQQTHYLGKYELKLLKQNFDELAQYLGLITQTQITIVQNQSKLTLNQVALLNSQREMHRQLDEIDQSQAEIALQLKGINVKQDDVIEELERITNDQTGTRQIIDEMSQRQVQIEARLGDIADDTHTLSMSEEKLAEEQINLRKEQHEINEKLSKILGKQCQLEQQLEQELLKLPTEKTIEIIKGIFNALPDVRDAKYAIAIPYIKRLLNLEKLDDETVALILKELMVETIDRFEYDSTPPFVKRLLVELIMICLDKVVVEDRYNVVDNPQWQVLLEKLKTTKLSDVGNIADQVALKYAYEYIQQALKYITSRPTKDKLYKPSRDLAQALRKPHLTGFEQAVNAVTKFLSSVDCWYFEALAIRVFSYPFFKGQKSSDDIVDKPELHIDAYGMLQELQGRIKKLCDVDQNPSWQVCHAAQMALLQKIENANSLLLQEQAFSGGGLFGLSHFVEAFCEINSPYQKIEHRQFSKGIGILEAVIRIRDDARCQWLSDRFSLHYLRLKEVCQSNHLDELTAYLEEYPGLSLRTQSEVYPSSPLLRWLDSKQTTTLNEVKLSEQADLNYVYKSYELCEQALEQGLQPEQLTDKLKAWYKTVISLKHEQWRFADDLLRQLLKIDQHFSNSEKTTWQLNSDWDDFIEKLECLGLRRSLLLVTYLEKKDWNNAQFNLDLIISSIVKVIDQGFHIAPNFLIWVAEKYIHIVENCLYNKNIEEINKNSTRYLRLFAQLSEDKQIILIERLASAYRQAGFLNIAQLYYGQVLTLIYKGESIQHRTQDILPDIEMVFMLHNYQAFLQQLPLYLMFHDDIRDYSPKFSRLKLLLDNVERLRGHLLSIHTKLPFEQEQLRILLLELDNILLPFIESTLQVLIQSCKVTNPNKGHASQHFIDIFWLMKLVKTHAHKKLLSSVINGYKSIIQLCEENHLGGQEFLQISMDAELNMHKVEKDISRLENNSTNHLDWMRKRLFTEHLQNPPDPESKADSALVVAPIPEQIPINPQPASYWQAAEPIPWQLQQQYQELNENFYFSMIDATPQNIQSSYQDYNEGLRAIFMRSVQHTLAYLPLPPDSQFVLLVTSPNGYTWYAPGDPLQIAILTNEQQPTIAWDGLIHSVATLFNSLTGQSLHIQYISQALPPNKRWIGSSEVLSDQAITLMHQEQSKQGLKLALAKPWFSYPENDAQKPEENPLWQAYQQKIEQYLYPAKANAQHHHQLEQLFSTLQQPENAERHKSDAKQDSDNQQSVDTVHLVQDYIAPIIKWCQRLTLLASIKTGNPIDALAQLIEQSYRNNRYLDAIFLSQVQQTIAQLYQLHGQFRYRYEQTGTAFLSPNGEIMPLAPDVLYDPTEIQGPKQLTLSLVQVEQLKQIRKTIMTPALSAQVKIHPDGEHVQLTWQNLKVMPKYYKDAQRLMTGLYTWLKHQKESQYQSLLQQEQQQLPADDKAVDHNLCQIQRAQYRFDNISRSLTQLNILMQGIATAKVYDVGQEAVAWDASKALDHDVRNLIDNFLTEFVQGIYDSDHRPHLEWLQRLFQCLPAPSSLSGTQLNLRAHIIHCLQIELSQLEKTIQAQTYPDQNEINRKACLQKLIPALQKYPTPDGHRYIMSVNDEINPEWSWQQTMRSLIVEPQEEAVIEDEKISDDVPTWLKKVNQTREKKLREHSRSTYLAWYDPIQNVVVHGLLREDIQQQLIPEADFEQQQGQPDPNHPKRCPNGQQLVLKLIEPQSQHNLDDHKEEVPKQKVLAFAKIPPKYPAVQAQASDLQRRIGARAIHSTLCHSAPSQGSSYAIQFSEPMRYTMTQPTKSTVCIENQDSENAVPASFTIHDVESALNPYDFTIHFLALQAVRSEDGKFTNVGIEEIIDEYGEKRYRFVDIDQDQSFVSAIDEEEIKKTGKIISKSKHIINCSSFMQQSMDDNAVADFLKLDPWQVTTAWLDDQSKRQKVYCGFKKANQTRSGLFSFNEMAQLFMEKQCFMPFLLDRPHDGVDIVLRIQKMQAELRKYKPGTYPTPMALLQKIENNLGVLHRMSFSTEEEIPSNIVTRFEKLKKNYMLVNNEAHQACGIYFISSQDINLPEKYKVLVQRKNAIILLQTEDSYHIYFKSESDDLCHKIVKAGRLKELLIKNKHLFTDEGNLINQKNHHDLITAVQQTVIQHNGCIHRLAQERYLSTLDQTKRIGQSTYYHQVVAAQPRLTRLRSAFNNKENQLANHLRAGSMLDPDTACAWVLTIAYKYRHRSEELEKIKCGKLQEFNRWPSELQRQFINMLNFDDMTVVHQRRLLQVIIHPQDGGFIRQLDLSYCQALDNTYLKQLLTHHPQISGLKLSYCHFINYQTMLLFYKYKHNIAVFNLNGHHIINDNGPSRKLIIREPRICQLVIKHYQELENLQLKAPELETQRSQNGSSNFYPYRFSWDKKTTLLIEAVSYDQKDLVHFLLENNINVNQRNKKGFSALAEAVYRKRYDLVMLLLKYNADPNVTLVRGTPVLTQAIRDEQLELVEQLLVARADPNRMTKSGYYSALSEAAEKEDPRYVEALLRSQPGVKPVKVNQTLKYQNSTALFGAIRKGSIQTISSLLENGAKVDHINSKNETTLMEAARRGDLEIVKCLLEKISTPEEQLKFICKKDSEGRAAIVQAAEYGYFSIVQYLKTKGACHDEVTFNQVLNATLNKECFDVVNDMLSQPHTFNLTTNKSLLVLQQLIKADQDGKLNVDLSKFRILNLQKMNDYMSVLLYAARYGNYKMLVHLHQLGMEFFTKSKVYGVQRLALVEASRGIVLNIVKKVPYSNSRLMTSMIYLKESKWSSQGEYSWYYAYRPEPSIVYRGELDNHKGVISRSNIRELLNKCINQQSDFDDNEKRHLLIAQIIMSRHGHIIPGHTTPKVIQYLLDHGADINQRDQHGYTALMCAAESNDIELVQLLLKHKNDIPDISLADKTHETALMKAAQRGYYEIVDIILNYKHMQPSDKDKNQALEFAAREGYLKVVKLLQSHGAEVRKGFCKDYETTRALINAAKIGNLRIIEILNDMGVDLNYEYDQRSYDADQEGQYETVWYHEVRGGAAFGGITSQELGPLVSAKRLYTDNRHCTPLMFAARYGHLDAVKYLLAHGADKNKLDRDYMKALDYAKKYGRDKIIDCLSNNDAQFEVAHQVEDTQTTFIRLSAGDQQQDLKDEVKSEQDAKTTEAADIEASHEETHRDHRNSVAQIIAQNPHSPVFGQGNQNQHRVDTTIDFEEQVFSQQGIPEHKSL